MKALICELCGSDDFLKHEGFFTCQHCNTKYTLEEAREIFGTIKIDKTEEIENLYQLARRAKNNGHSPNASKYYEKILLQRPDCWEASFYHIYFDSMESKLDDIPSTMVNLRNAGLSSLSMIIDNEEKDANASQLLMDLRYIGHIFADSAGDYFKKYEQSEEDYSNWLILIHDMLFRVGEEVYNNRDIYGKETHKACAGLLKESVDILQMDSRLASANKKLINKTIEMILKLDPNYKVKTKNCYIATCAYGSYDCPQLWTLRRYRDYLDRRLYGRIFIRVYYLISPYLIGIFGHIGLFRSISRKLLDIVVLRLKKHGIEDTPYEDS